MGLEVARVEAVTAEMVACCAPHPYTSATTRVGCGELSHGADSRRRGEGRRALFAADRL